MASTAIINKVKTDLRIVHTALDGDIADNIDACLADLRICGVTYPVDDDPAILNLIKLWSRAAYSDDTAKQDAYMARYNAMKATLMMAAGYGAPSEEGGEANG